MKKLTFILPFLLALLLVLGYAPDTARADTDLTEPTTCAHNANEIAGRMTLDADHDALPDPAEGVPGITFTLANIQSGTTVLQTVTTDVEGCYRFNRALLVNGHLHRISWSGINPTNNLVHDPDNGVTPGTPNFVFTAAAAQPFETDVVYRSESVQPYITSCPFTNGSTGDIGGMVAFDLNGNNQADPGEGIEGAVVTFAVANPTQVLTQDVTDLNGCYRLERRAPATEAISGNSLNGGDHSGDDISGNSLNGGDHSGEDISGNSLNDAPAGIQGCCNHLQEGDAPAGIQGCCNHLQEGDAPAGIQGCCNHRTPATTYMYLRAYLPAPYGGIAPSYDPNGRQTENAFYEIFTTPNGDFETDFLVRDFTPTAVSVSTFGVSPVAPAWLTFAVSGLTLLGTTLVLFRRRATVK